MASRSLLASAFALSFILLPIRSDAAWSWDIVARFPDRYSAIVNPTSTTSVASAPDGSVQLTRNPSVAVHPPAGSGTARSAVVTVTRAIPKAAWIPKVAKYAKGGLPSIIGMVVLDLIWDEATQEWLKPLPTGGSTAGICEGNVGQLVRIVTGPWWEPVVKYGVTTLTSSPQSTCPSHPVYNPSEYGDPGNCTNLQSECGYFPLSAIKWVGEENINEARKATTQDIANAINQTVTADPEKADDFVRAVYDSSPAAASDIESDVGPSNVSGPSSLSPSTTTSTDTTPAGTTITTTSNQIHISYSGDTITITNVTTITTTDPSGVTTTQTKTETGDSTGSSSGQSNGGTDAQTDFCLLHPNASACLPFPNDFCTLHPTASACQPFPQSESEDPGDPCIEHPDRAGCSELGDVSDVQLPTQSAPISFVPTLSASGSCPSPRSVSTSYGSLEFSYQPICDFATGLRPLVIALSLIGAGALVFGAVKT